jgi:hypothetical protein
MERAALSRVWGILLSGPVLSAVWLLACGAYIHTQVGWDVLPIMLPNEIAVTVLGVTMPLAFIWVVSTFRTLSEPVRDAAGSGARMRPHGRARRYLRHRRCRQALSDLVECGGAVEALSSIDRYVMVMREQEPLVTPP